jgi:hypothetical protein
VLAASQSIKREWGAPNEAESDSRSLQIDILGYHESRIKEQPTHPLKLVAIMTLFAAPSNEFVFSLFAALVGVAYLILAALVPGLRGPQVGGPMRYLIAGVGALVVWLGAAILCDSVEFAVFPPQELTLTGFYMNGRHLLGILLGLPAGVHSWRASLRAATKKG